MTCGSHSECSQCRAPFCLDHKRPQSFYYDYHTKISTVNETRNYSRFNCVLEWPLTKLDLAQFSREPLANSSSAGSVTLD